MVAHDARGSSPVRLRPTIGDRLVVDLPRERELRHAGVVEVPDLSTAEPVDGKWWNPKPALARATPSRLLADAEPRTSRSAIISSSSFMWFLLAR